MKKLILVGLLFLTGLNAKSQVVDSTEIKITKLEKAVLHMSDNLSSAHHQFKVGLILNSIGLFGAVSTASIEDNSDLQTLLYIGSGTISLIGIIMMIDSHKYIGRAGNVFLTKNGITIEF